MDHLTLLERLMQISHDIKKDYSYVKHAGTWSWFDRDERDNLDAHHTGFATFFDALSDAVAPYLDENEDDELDDSIIAAPGDLPGIAALAGLDDDFPFTLGDLSVQEVGERKIQLFVKYPGNAESDIPGIYEVEVDITIAPAQAARVAINRLLQEHPNVSADELKVTVMVDGDIVSKIDDTTTILVNHQIPLQKL